MYLALAEVMQTSSFTLPIFHTTQVMRPVISEPEDAEKSGCGKGGVQSQVMKCLV